LHHFPKDRVNIKNIQNHNLEITNKKTQIGDRDFQGFMLISPGLMLIFQGVPRYKNHQQQKLIRAIFVNRIFALQSIVHVPLLY